MHPISGILVIVSLSPGLCSRLHILPPACCSVVLKEWAHILLQSGLHCPPPITRKSSTKEIEGWYCKLVPLGLTQWIHGELIAMQTLSQVHAPPNPGAADNSMHKTLFRTERHFLTLSDCRWYMDLWITLILFKNTTLAPLQPWRKTSAGEHA